MTNNKKVAKLCKKCRVEKVDKHLLPFVIVGVSLLSALFCTLWHILYHLSQASITI